jgi:perosamine synthetase
MTERIPLAIPDLRGNESAYLLQCVEDNWVSSAGPFVTACEVRLAALTTRAHAVATVNGTTALQLALAEVGVRPGDYVVVPDWTFAATANAVFHLGATPVFADVTEESWSLDPKSLKEILDAPPGRIAAVVVVHALGHAADVDPLLSLCREMAVPLVEDAAGALGSAYKERPIGSLGDAAIFSFNGNKTVTAGGGGMIVMDSEEGANNLRALSSQARSGSEYRYSDIGYNYRMTNVNAGLLLAQLERLDEMVEAKRRISDVYDEAVGGRDDLLISPRASWARSSCWLYALRTHTEDDAQSLVQHMAAQNIEARTFWRSLSAQAPYAHAPHRLTGVAAALSGTVVTLPSSSSLSEPQQIRVIDALNTWRSGAGA